jgi:hypothetical protein
LRWKIFSFCLTGRKNKKGATKILRYQELLQINGTLCTDSPHNKFQVANQHWNSASEMFYNFNFKNTWKNKSSELLRSDVVFVLLWCSFFCKVFSLLSKDKMEYYFEGMKIRVILSLSSNKCWTILKKIDRKVLRTSKPFQIFLQNSSHLELKYKIDKWSYFCIKLKLPWQRGNIIG